MMENKDYIKILEKLPGILAELSEILPEENIVGILITNEMTDGIRGCPVHVRVHNTVLDESYIRCIMYDQLDL